MEELKKCPFCGGEAGIKMHYATNEDVITTKWCVVCKGCGANGLTSFSKEYAIESWNTREPVERILECIEEYQEDAEHYGFASAINDLIEVVKEEVG